ncbi:MAG: type IV secretory system conjugative DNA transfer family protein [Bacilli bacterium]|nr:type IV secretory system conjugative DNA transfer family protein [Bacilli bacterium]
MKLRISGKDLLIFSIFAILLFYLCSLATTNISAISAGGELTLNPISGLTEFLGATLVLFVICIVLIITSVSSLVFERKKGFGFEINEKEEKGYSRWAKDKEIKNDKDVEVVDPLATDSEFAGIPLVNDGKKLWVDNGEYHNLVIGATGSGKSQTIVEPLVELLIKKGESMIITDPKGELYRAASDYLRERGYNVIVLNFRDPQNGNAWNPLTLPYQYYKDGNSDKATELLDDVALNILYDPNNKGEPFWEKSAADYFSGLALGLFQDAREEEINLNSISYMSTVGEDKFAASTYIKEYFTMKGEASNAYVFASNTINAPADTKGGILSVFRQKIRLFASRENLSEMLAYSDFDMRDIGKQKTAVFIVIQDEKTTYHGLATIFIKQVYETLIDVAQRSPNGKLPYRTNFILDEFANMPPLKDVTTMVTAARSRAIRFTFIIQNFAQLKQVYGNENAETIKGNCGNLVYLISTELAALEEISKMCGEVKSSDKDKTASTPLVTVTDLQKLKLFEAIIIRWRKSPFKTKYTPNFKMDWGHPHSSAEFPIREEKAIELFDVKTYVKEKKRENMLNSLDSGKDASKGFGDMNSPFGGSNPFASKPGPFSAPDSDSGGSGLFGGLGGGLDLDAMMRDIDKKIAELDAEEARQKAELEKKKKEEAEEKKNEVVEFNTDVKEDKKYDISDLTIPDINEFDTFKIDDSISSTKKEQLNIYDDSITEDKKDHFVNSNIDNGEISFGSEKANIAVATSSPVDEDEFNFDDGLPKVEEASIIQPTYTSGSVVKTSDENEYNIYNTIPNIMNTVKDVSFEEVEDKSSKVDVIQSVEEKVEKKTIPTNVNINLEDVRVDNSVITDDQFFDDFFGDD